LWLFYVGGKWWPGGDCLGARGPQARREKGLRLPGLLGGRRGGGQNGKGGEK